MPAIIAADRASRAFEISNNPNEQYLEQATRERAALAKQQPVSQRLLVWGRENRYPIIGASWVLSMGLAFAIVGRSPYLTTSQKLVQARVYAQGLTLAVLIASAAFEISDRDTGDDSSDPEHKHSQAHHESYRGEDQWKGWSFRHLVPSCPPVFQLFPPLGTIDLNAFIFQTHYWLKYFWLSGAALPELPHHPRVQVFHLQG